jgi:hypothetical protein
MFYAESLLWKAIDGLWGRPISMKTELSLMGNKPRESLFGLSSCCANQILLQSIL